MLEPYNSEHEEALMWKAYGYTPSNQMVYCDLCRDSHEELSQRQGTVSC